jgi:uncharacterized membrane protein YeiB
MRLFLGGLALAVVSRLLAWVLPYPAGGLARLAAVTPRGDDGVSVREQLLWSPSQGRSWWYLALPSPHANTPVDLAHTIGSAMAILGAALLLTRAARGSRILRPLADIGSMTLTLYTAHVVVLSTDLLSDHATLLYTVLVVGSVAFAVLWRRRYGQGPLERLVAEVSGRARRDVMDRLARPSPSASV